MMAARGPLAAALAVVAVAAAVLLASAVGPASAAEEAAGVVAASRLEGSCGESSSNPPVVLVDRLPGTGAPCCGGNRCPLAGGVCCRGGNHCCPAGSRCLGVDANGDQQCGVRGRGLDGRSDWRGPWGKSGAARKPKRAAPPPEPLPPQLSVALTQARGMKQMSREELASKTDITVQRIINFEMAEEVPTADELSRIARALEITLPKAMTPLYGAEDKESFQPRVIRRDFSVELEQKRIARGLTRKILAKATGIPEAKILSFENDEEVANAVEAGRLGAALGTRLPNPATPAKQPGADLTKLLPEIRAQKGLSVAALADLANVRQEVIRGLESGKIVPTRSLRAKLDKALDTSLEFAAAPQRDPVAGFGLEPERVPEGESRSPQAAANAAVAATSTGVVISPPSPAGAAAAAAANSSAGSAAAPAQKQAQQAQQAAQKQAEAKATAAKVSASVNMLTSLLHLGKPDANLMAAAAEAVKEAQPQQQAAQAAAAQPANQAAAQQPAEKAQQGGQQQAAAAAAAAAQPQEAANGVAQMLAAKKEQQEKDEAAARVAWAAKLEAANREIALLRAMSANATAEGKAAEDRAVDLRMEAAEAQRQLDRLKALQEERQAAYDALQAAFVAAVQKALEEQKRLDAIEAEKLRKEREAIAERLKAEAEAARLADIANENRVKAEFRKVLDAVANTTSVEIRSSTASQFCFSAAAPKVASGDEPALWPCGEQPERSHWRFGSDLTVRPHRNISLCLARAGADRLALRQCNQTDPSQRFEVQQKGTRLAQGGLCLGLTGPFVTGQPVTMVDCDLWRAGVSIVDPKTPRTAPSPSWLVHHAGSNSSRRCVEASDAGPRLVTCDASNRMLMWASFLDGTVRPASQPTVCLTGPAADKARAALRPCVADGELADAQRWRSRQKDRLYAASGAWLNRPQLPAQENYLSVSLRPKADLAAGTASGSDEPLSLDQLAEMDVDPFQWREVGAPVDAASVAEFARQQAELQAARDRQAAEKSAKISEHLPAVFGGFTLAPYNKAALGFEPTPAANYVRVTAAGNAAAKTGAVIPRLRLRAGRNYTVEVAGRLLGDRARLGQFRACPFGAVEGGLACTPALSLGPLESVVRLTGRALGEGDVYADFGLLFGGEAQSGDVALVRYVSVFEAGSRASPLAVAGSWRWKAEQSVKAEDVEDTDGGLSLQLTDPQPQGRPGARYDRVSLRKGRRYKVILRGRMLSGPGRICPWVQLGTKDVLVACGAGASLRVSGNHHTVTAPFDAPADGEYFVGALFSGQAAGTAARLRSVSVTPLSQADLLRERLAARAKAKAAAAEAEFVRFQPLAVGGPALAATGGASVVSRPQDGSHQLHVTAGGAGGGVGLVIRGLRTTPGLEYTVVVAGRRAGGSGGYRVCAYASAPGGWACAKNSTLGDRAGLSSVGFRTAAGAPFVDVGVRFDGQAKGDTALVRWLEVREAKSGQVLLRTGAVRWVRNLQLSTSDVALPGGGFGTDMWAPAAAFRPGVRSEGGVTLRGNTSYQLEVSGRLSAGPGRLCPWVAELTGKSLTNEVPVVTACGADDSFADTESVRLVNFTTRAGPDGVFAVGALFAGQSRDTRGFVRYAALRPAVAPPAPVNPFAAAEALSKLTPAQLRERVTTDAARAAEKALADQQAKLRVARYPALVGGAPLAPSLGVNVSVLAGAEVGGSFLRVVANTNASTPGLLVRGLRSRPNETYRVEALGYAEGARGAQRAFLACPYSSAPGGWRCSAGDRTTSLPAAEGPAGVSFVAPASGAFDVGVLLAGMRPGDSFVLRSLRLVRESDGAEMLVAGAAGFAATAGVKLQASAEPDGGASLRLSDGRPGAVPGAEFARAWLAANTTYELVARGRVAAGPGRACPVVRRGGATLLWKCGQGSGLSLPSGAADGRVRAVFTTREAGPHTVGLLLAGHSAATVAQLRSLVVRRRAPAPDDQPLPVEVAEHRLAAAKAMLEPTAHLADDTESVAAAARVRVDSLRDELQVAKDKAAAAAADVNSARVRLDESKGKANQTVAKAAAELEQAQAKVNSTRAAQAQAQARLNQAAKRLADARARAAAAAERLRALRAEVALGELKLELARAAAAVAPLARVAAAAKAARESAAAKAKQALAAHKDDPDDDSLARLAQFAAVDLRKATDADKAAAGNLAAARTRLKNAREAVDKAEAEADAAWRARVRKQVGTLAAASSAALKALQAQQKALAAARAQAAKAGAAGGAAAADAALLVKRQELKAGTAEVARWKAHLAAEALRKRLADHEDDLARKAADDQQFRADQAAKAAAKAAKRLVAAKADVVRSDSGDNLKAFRAAELAAADTDVKQKQAQEVLQRLSKAADAAEAKTRSFVSSMTRTAHNLRLAVAAEARLKAAVKAAEKAAADAKKAAKEAPKATAAPANQAAQKVGQQAAQAKKA